MSDISREEARELAKMAADEAVVQLFRALGVNINDQQDLNDLRSDLIYSRRLRRLTESGTSRAFLIIVGLAAVGLATLVWGSIKQALGIE